MEIFLFILITLTLCANKLKADQLFSNDRLVTSFLSFFAAAIFFSNKLRIYFSSTKQDKYDASQSICTDNAVTDFLLFIHRIKLRWKLFWQHPNFEATVVIIVRKTLEKTRVLQFIDAQPLIGNISSNNIVFLPWFSLFAQAKTSILILLGVSDLRWISYCTFL